jgi:hypothetical protein
MCRSIKPLNNLEPPATPAEVQEAATQYVRKLSGTVRPSQANQEVFDAAVQEVAAATQRLLSSLTTAAAPRDRAVEAAKARARNEARYGEGAGR